MLRFATILAALVFASTTQAQQVTMVLQKGDCPTYMIAGESNVCQAMLYMMFYQTGRSAFNFPTENGALMLSGGRDSQLTPERYVLEIDTIRITENEMTRNYDATGRCQEMRQAARDFVTPIFHDIMQRNDSDLPTGAKELVAKEMLATLKKD